MNAIRSTIGFLALAATTGCLLTEESAADVGSSQAALTSSTAIKDIPAVDRTRYPDSVGFVHQGSLATVLWLQNEPQVGSLGDLERLIARDMQTGVKGEILDSAMQRIEPVGGLEPSLRASAKRTAQSVRLMAQYAAVTSDYEQALGDALAAYNGSPDRIAALAAKAATVNTLLHEVADANRGGAPPRSPPPLSEQVIRPGRHLADVVREHARLNLNRTVDALQRAITTRDVARYGGAFADVFFAQRDANVGQIAVEGLSVHHVNGLLHGHPLDSVIARHVNTQPTADRPMSMDQLCLINQLNLMAGDASVSRNGLVAALLLLDEDHRQGERDATLSPSVIKPHAQDAGWSVSQLVRLKANGTTEAQVNELIASIVAAL